VPWNLVIAPAFYVQSRATDINKLGAPRPGVNRVKTPVRKITEPRESPGAGKARFFAGPLLRRVCRVGDSVSSGDPTSEYQIGVRV
jgi:hypothetical protein